MRNMSNEFSITPSVYSSVLLLVKTHLTCSMVLKTFEHKVPTYDITPSTLEPHLDLPTSHRSRRLQAVQIADLVDSLDCDVVQLRRLLKDEIINNLRIRSMGPTYCVAG